MHWERFERRKHKNLGDWQLISEGRGKAERGRAAAAALHGPVANQAGTPVRRGRPCGAAARSLGSEGGPGIGLDCRCAGGLHTDQIRTGESGLAGFCTE